MPLLALLIFSPVFVIVAVVVLAGYLILGLTSLLKTSNGAHARR